MNYPPNPDEYTSPVLHEVPGDAREAESLRRVTMTTSTGIPISRTTWTGGTDPYIGAVIDGKYEVIARLGEGGMGVVYQCRHTIIDRYVAMKVLRVDMARNHENTQRFLNEARSASTIGNPHIIDILDFGELPDGATYFLMEFLEGEPLTALLNARQRLPFERLLGIALQLTEALGAAHHAGIVHRDLKPDNVFLVERGQIKDFVKVLDFGIAKANSATNQLTQAGQVFGTPHYMSPEQAGGRDVDARSDIYALGVMLYEIGLGIAPELEAVILRCLQKSPENRYASMEQLGADLRTLLDGGTPVAYVSPLRTSVDSLLSNLGLARSTSLYPRERGTDRGSIGLWILGTACVALGAWLVFWLGGSSEGAAQGNSPVALPTPNSTATPPVASSRPAAVAAEPRRVALAVSPFDARVTLDQEDLGKSPIWLEVKGPPLTLHVERPGYTPKTVLIDGTQGRVTVELVRVREKPAKATPTPARGSTPTAPNDSGIIDPWKH
jgi:eukaryotic-like serine/threonine-protein kinase